MALTAMVFVDDDVQADGHERRTSPRRPIARETTVRRSGQAVEAVLHDLSTTGASVETAAPLTQGSVITIGLAGVGRFPATVVSAAGTRFGCRFIEPLVADSLHRAFASDPLVVGAFGGVADAVGYAEPELRPYPGIVRIALPVGGAIAGWALILRAVGAMMGH